MIHDPIFAERAAIMLFSTIIIGAAVSSAWYRRNNEDKSSFWFSIGVAIHWAATGNSCLFATLEDMDLIDFPMKDVLLPFNLALIFTAGCFYVRALTMHINDFIWQIAAASMIAVGLIVYIYQTIFVFQASSYG